MGISIRRSARALAMALLVAAGAANLAEAQSVLDRTPNLGGTWTGNPGVVHFNFLHRFTVGGEPQSKVGNGPTFLLAASVPANLLFGVRYATNSQVATNFPNEWEFFGRWNPLAQARGAPLDVAVHAGLNDAAEGVDGELALARRFGRLRVIGNGRWFSAAYDGDSARFAFGAGAALRITDHLALAGDWATLLDASDDEDAAWGVALQIAIPYTPHSLSIQATNTNTATLEGSSIGTGVTRYGFEFTIPITLSRYFGGGGSAAAAPSSPATTASGDTVRIVMRDLKYQTTDIVIAPGTTVVWVNEDAVQHSVTSDNGAFDSGLVDPRGSWSRTFDAAGTFPYHCTPHPFMKGTVMVR